MTIAPRPPLDLRQDKPFTGLSLITANLLWMYRLTDLPDPEAVQRELERRSRVPGEVTTSTMLLYLLEQGLSMHHVYPFDERRFIAEGEAYYREFYAAEWEPDWDELITPRLIEELRKECELHRAEFDRYSEVSTEENRPVTFTDVLDALNRHGMAVVYSRTAAEAGRAAKGIAYGWDGDTLAIFEPHHDGSIDALWPQDFTAYWLPSEGISAIWLATKS